MCPRCRDAVAGWARGPQSGAGNRWAAIAAAAAARRRADGKHGRRQAEEAELRQIDCRRKSAPVRRELRQTAGGGGGIYERRNGRRKRRKLLQFFNEAF